MSDKEEKKDKVVTKYDLKMQRRQAEKLKEQRQKKIATVIGVVVIVALAAWIASFPIRNYVATHETFIVVNGEEITRAEFDYNYNNVVSQYISQFGAYISYFGLDTSRDFASQMYSDTMTWEDYFQEMTVDNLKQSKGLKAQADSSGFVYDGQKEISNFKETVKSAAKEAGMSTASYVRQIYGQYATVDNISKYIAETARTNAYLEEISEGMKASDEEIEQYYKEHAAEYDSVDYFVSTYPAELSEEPTEEEISTAMDAVRSEAEAAEADIMSEGDEQINVKQSEISYLISDWLFEDTRKKGDTTIIEDDSSHLYYVLGFVQRYLDDAPSADIRMIMTQEMDGQAVLDEWAAGDATEESFAELCNQYSADNGEIAEGGLYEGVTQDSVNADASQWIFAKERKAGDTGYVTTAEGYTYVMYYIGQGDPQWKTEISQTLLSQATSDYLSDLSDDVIVTDEKGHLNYLKIREAEAAAEVTSGDLEDVSGSDVTGDSVLEESSGEESGNEAP